MHLQMSVRAWMLCEAQECAQAMPGSVASKQGRLCELTGILFKILPVA